MCVYTYTCISTHMYVCVYMHVYVYSYICVYNTYIYVYSHSLSRLLWKVRTAIHIF